MAQETKSSGATDAAIFGSGSSLTVGSPDQVAHVLQNVGDTNLLVSVRGRIRGSAFEEPRGRLANRMMKDAPNSRPPSRNNLGQSALIELVTPK